ncbi:cell division protein ZapE [Dokdonella sp.]|uniref:cell division protein ZapE n=1 Tax=Dokdonella sp. TaxID=2291710 RepID=UPI001B17A475|nr:cell division protein ZapE [Dokdonella sp.]MBO9661725.1 AFG1 family ATPase [Dokdonella sp.]
MSLAAGAAGADTPSARYLAGVAAGEWQDDPAQRAALVALDRLHAELAERRTPSLWQRLRGEAPDAPRGLYLWGRVGRGKTFLCDLFYESLATPAKRRVHFHRFMQDVHAELRSLDGRSDPLVEVAARLAGEVRVLVLDEFFVGDIGDAMILANLLRALFERGVVLVTTSNTPPPELYKDGLQRERFLPAIALIERHCEVHELASPQDFRLRALKRAPVYYTPPGSAAERAMLAAFNRVAHGAAREDFTTTLNERPVAVRREADGAIWFEFGALCEGPRAVADYIEIAKAFHTILVSNVPQFTPQTDDAARRFIELVDEVYDRGVNLVLSAAAPIVELYDGERLRAEFARTESRLIEMQSEEYLAREHRA